MDTYYAISENLTYRKDYGFSFFKFKGDNNYRLCSPFLRKDTPIHNSNFSSILLQLILTFKTYIIEFKQKLQTYDFDMIINDSYILSEFKTEDFPPNKLDELHNVIYQHQDKTIKNLNELVSNIFTQIYQEEEIYAANILLKYLFYVNASKLKITSKQLNMSFQDIIYNNYEQWQVGYSGTASLTLGEYCSDDKFVFKNPIIYDHDEVIEVNLALNGFGTQRNELDEPYNSLVKILYYADKSLDTNIKLIMDAISGDARGLIDLEGFFINESNVSVAKHFYDFMKILLPNKRVVYFDNNDIALEYNEKGSRRYDHNADNFFYYDQTHVVGSDLKQPINGNFIIIVNERSKMTNFAQGIFRFRNLNRGTYMNILYASHIPNIPNKTNHEIKLLLLENEEKFNLNQKDGINFQIIKAIVRKSSKNYLESDLKPDFLIESPIDDFTIIN